MLGYVTLGTNNLAAAAAFYDALFADTDICRMMETEGYYIYWSSSQEQPGLALVRPYDGKPATLGNGVMVAMHMPDVQTVNKLYTKAIELGASDEGAPGYRGESTSEFYAGYFRDLDGNKLNFFTMQAQQA